MLIKIFSFFLGCILLTKSIILWSIGNEKCFLNSDFDSLISGMSLKLIVLLATNVLSKFF